MVNWRRVVAGVCLAGGLAVAATDYRAAAEIPEVSAPISSEKSSVIAGLSDPKRSQATLDAVLETSNAGTVLAEIAGSHVDVVARGWAVVGLSRVKGDSSTKALEALAVDAEAPVLVRTWAAAGAIARANTLSELSTSGKWGALRYQLPALDRPLTLRSEALLAGASLEDLLRASIDPSLAQMVSPLVIARAKPDELVSMIYTSKDDTLRRQAAAFAAAVAQSAPQKMMTQVIEQLRFSKTGRVPWEGGALYVPALAWQGGDATALTEQLMRWWLYLLEVKKDAAAAQQAFNNLYSYTLLTNAGYQMSFSEPMSLLREVQSRKGAGAARQLLADVGLSGDPRFVEFQR